MEEEALGCQAVRVVQALLGMMVLVLIAQTFVVFLAYGALAARAGHLLCRQPRIMVLFQTGIAALFAGLGLRVVLGGR